MDLFNDFSLGLFVWQSVLFLALLFLLRKYAWSPSWALEEREEGIKNALDAAENAKQEMQALNADNERILQEAKAERDAILKDAREMKDTIIAEAKAQATAEADKVMTSAREHLNNEKMAAMTDLKTKWPPVHRHCRKNTQIRAYQGSKAKGNDGQSTRRSHRQLIWETPEQHIDTPNRS